MQQQGPQGARQKHTRPACWVASGPSPSTLTPSPRSRTPLTHSRTHPPNHSFTHSPACPPTHTLTHSLTLFLVKGIAYRKVGSLLLRSLTSGRSARWSSLQSMNSMVSTSKGWLSTSVVCVRGECMCCACVCVVSQGRQTEDDERTGDVVTEWGCVLLLRHTLAGDAFFYGTSQALNPSPKPQIPNPRHTCHNAVRPLVAWVKLLVEFHQPPAVACRVQDKGPRHLHSLLLPASTLRLN